MSLPLVMTAAGPVPATPAELDNQLIALVTAAQPGYTANLPGSMIEDISSTDVFAILLCDQAQVDLINALTPYGANAFILAAQGATYGITVGAEVNTSVEIVFSGSSDTYGFEIPIGFTVSDGNYQYVAQGSGIVSNTGSSLPILFVALLSGSWTVPQNTVTQIDTSLPATITTLTCTNPLAGIPSSGAETEESYRARVLDAGLVEAQGTPTYMKTLIKAVPGVQARLVSIVKNTSTWSIMVGGGDQYQVAQAIFEGIGGGLPILAGSTLSPTAITKANPGVVTTNVNHGYTGTPTVTFNSVGGMTQLNGNSYVATPISPNSFSIAVDTTGFTTFTSGGVITPNLRNQSVSINDYPDTYTVPFIVPLQELVTISLTWNTTATNLISDDAVAAAGSAALVSYVNSIGAGQPMNQFEMDTVFQVAIASIVPPDLLTRLVWVITINGLSVSVTSGTGLYAADLQSYLYCTSANVTIVRG